MDIKINEEVVSLPFGIFQIVGFLYYLWVGRRRVGGIRSDNSDFQPKRDTC